MTAAFDYALAFVLGQEGGYSNNPNDPGGETNFGISKRAYPDLDIASLTHEQAAAIYRRDYWERIKGDELPYAIALITFDSAVNCGVDRAVRWLQQATGAKQDGIIGPATIRAAEGQEWREVATRILTARNMHNVSLSQFSAFGVGWSRRLFRLALATSGQALIPHLGEVG